GEELKRDPGGLREWLVREGITVSHPTTPVVEQLLEEEWEGGPRQLLTGSDVLRKRPREGLPFELVNTYGPTEQSVVSTWGAVPAGGVDGRLPGIGRPIGN